MASVAVVEAVGARPSGQASRSIATDRWRSAWRASGEAALAVIATSGMPIRFRVSTRRISSSVVPE